MTHPEFSETITRPFRKAIQAGVVVPDPDQSMAPVFGMGPFHMIACPPPGQGGRS